MATLEYEMDGDIPVVVFKMTKRILFEVLEAGGYLASGVVAANGMPLLTAWLRDGNRHEIWLLIRQMNLQGRTFYYFKNEADMRQFFRYSRCKREYAEPVEVR